MSDKWHIHRRTFLRGLGAAVALPMLDAMVPWLGSVVSAATSTSQKFPKRMAFVYVPNGVTVPDWIPKETGTGFALPKILQPLETHRQDFSVLSGLSQRNGLPFGD